MKHVLLFLALLQSYVAVAQPYSAYYNIRQEFYVFDNGAVNKVEGMPPVSFKVGRRAVAYQDNTRTFKVYKQGSVTPITDLFTTQFEVSDNLVLYRSANMISVVDGDDVVLLSRLCNRYGLGDSVVLFFDINQATFNAYYNGKITELETYLAVRDHDFNFDSTVKVSDNIGAYINFNDQFKVFYQNNTEVLENQAVRSFQVGRNTVGYVDVNNIFKAYYKGQTYTLDPFMPKSYLVGDDMIAFQSSDGYFKVFHDGNLHTLGFYEPQYQMADRVLAFEDVNGYLKVFYEGKQVFIDIYYPEKLVMGYNSLVYTNKIGQLRMFSKGEVHDVSTMSIMNMRLDYDVLQYQVGFNAFKMFYNGEHYN